MKCLRAVQCRVGEDASNENNFLSECKLGHAFRNNLVETLAVEALSKPGPGFVIYKPCAERPFNLSEPKLKLDLCAELPFNLCRSVHPI
jgi:hypothetical protein